MTRDNKPVTGLQAADFAVTDNGVAQTIDSVRSASHLAVAFVFDASTDVSRSDWPAVPRAAHAIAAALQPGDTGASLLTLDRLVLLNPAGTLPSALDQTFAALPTPGLSRKMLWDAVLAGASLVAGDAGRPVVVCFSDGAKDFGWTSRKDALDALQLAGFALDAVTVPQVYYGQTDWDDVRKMPGSLVMAASDSGVGAKVAEQFDRLRNGYVLTYHPTGVPADGVHHVKVALTSQRADVSTRDSYVSGR